ncbi:transposase [Variovorax ureilyticus]|uniref:transposase n=1 Tax=Variovorax ureilyticus TaxID=1836198 RepID=UPI003BF573BB
MASTYFWRTPIHLNTSSRRVHSAEFKARILAECRQPGASISAVAIAHSLNLNVVRKWLTGRGLKRTGDAAPAASGAVCGAPRVQKFRLGQPKKRRRSLQSNTASICVAER